MYYTMMGGGWIMNLVFVLWVIVIIAALIALIKWLVGEIADKNYKKADPLDVAKMRYSRGEITKSEYEEIKRELK